MSKTTATIAIVGGDGIGPEVTAQGRRILEWFAIRRGVDVTLVDAPYGALAYERFGAVLPDQTLELLRSAHAILFGSVGGPEYDAIPAVELRRGSLLSIRRDLDLFANLRPVKSASALHEVSSLKQRVLDGVDLVIVRELSGGLYFGQPRGIESMPNGEKRGVNTHSYTTSQILRVARDAFELARIRKRAVCSVDKSNVMEAGALWRSEVQALHDAEYPDVTLTHMLADNCAMQLVREPAQFDVIVTDNLFGDLLSDCAAMIAGSLGMLPSASLGARTPDGSRAALYEPVHGSAPDIAGRGIANPLGSILSVAMMLRLSLDAPDDAELLEAAISRALAAGARTGDIALDGQSRGGTAAMGDEVLRQLERGAN
ncbi:3-isopropylmalate dehydrogenase [Bradyrhizobium sp.]|uniref:3-isopropylmalate dehydrogenase n=1 Tax=Bradyrhizobium sp. TaxID=376 RepID=UPI004037E0D8